MQHGSGKYISCYCVTTNIDDDNENNYDDNMDSNKDNNGNIKS